MATQTKAARAARNIGAEMTEATEANAKRFAAAAGSMADKAESAFAKAGFEVPEMFRNVAEQGLNQTREAYSKMKVAAEEATDAIEESFGKSREGVMEFQRKSLEISKANADAAFDLMRQLLGATSVTDAFQLQSAFVRERFESLVDYSKDVQATYEKVANEASKPAKALFERAVAH